MVLILKTRLQASLWILKKIMQMEIILFLPNFLLLLETLGVYKIVVFRSTSLTLGLLNRKM